MKNHSAPKARLLRGQLLFALPLLLVCGGLLQPASSAAAGEKDPIGQLFSASFGHEAQGQTDKALSAVLKVLKKRPQHYIAHLRAGWLYYHKGRYDDSVQHYQSAMRLAPGALEPKLGLMLPLMAAKRWPEAEKIGEEILQKAPYQYTALSRMAYVAFLQGRYTEAESRYKKVLADYPSDVEMMLGLGWTYARQGRKKEAKGMFGEVLSIRPDNVSAKSGLSSL